MQRERLEIKQQEGSISISNRDAFVEKEEDAKRDTPDKTARSFNEYLELGGLGGEGGSCNER